MSSRPPEHERTGSVHPIRPTDARTSQSRPFTSLSLGPRRGPSDVARRLESRRPRLDDTRPECRPLGCTRWRAAASCATGVPVASRRLRWARQASVRRRAGSSSQWGQLQPTPGRATNTPMKTHSRDTHIVPGRRAACMDQPRVSHSPPRVRRAAEIQTSDSSLWARRAREGETKGQKIRFDNYGDISRYTNTQKYRPNPLSIHLQTRKNARLSTVLDASSHRISKGHRGARLAACPPGCPLLACVLCPRLSLLSVSLTVVSGCSLVTGPAPRANRFSHILRHVVVDRAHHGGWSVGHA